MGKAFALGTAFGGGTSPYSISEERLCYLLTPTSRGSGYGVDAEQGKWSPLVGPRTLLQARPRQAKAFDGMTRGARGDQIGGDLAHDGTKLEAVS
jgi:hypothetical protein